MKIIDKVYDSQGRLLVIYETKNGNLVGEVYVSGERVPGKWDSRATFYVEDKDAEPFRVMEYFRFA